MVNTPKQDSGTDLGTGCKAFCDKAPSGREALVRQSLVVSNNPVGEGLAPPEKTIIKSYLPRRDDLRSPENACFTYFITGEHGSPLRRKN